ncbi:MAG TPA: family 1 glycosylhydrolase [Sphingomicrobium sp.]|nr:family 1 glycosylhydrolase [Sphingomicrobium sp.]
MMRIVNLPKAAVAGGAGALAWEAAIRPALLTGVPFYDIVRELGTLAFPDGPWIAWWLTGLAAHVLGGIGWALFYANFFWARLDIKPAFQGLIFAALPAVLAIFLVTPQLQLMHLADGIVELDWGILLEPLTATAIAGLLAGHMLFGLVMGALYVRPAGYPVENERRNPPRYAARRATSANGRRTQSAGFMFATGIECSYPTIENGSWRRDQMKGTWHYDRWQQDFALAREIGITHIRYGPPLHLVLGGPGQYDWSLVDEPMAELEEFGPEPIIDLCHFGLPSWLGNFQNPDIPGPMSEFAGAFAQRYPWVRFYTPINEMFVCARLSTLEGLWNEQMRDAGAYVTAVVNMASATVAMEEAILRHRPDAIFIHAESSEFFQPCCPDPKIEEIARLENERRFLPLDLLFAHPVSDFMRDHIRQHGVDDKVYDRFMARQVPRRSILGVDYYEWNERLIDRDGEPRVLGELFGWYVIAQQYWQRYQRTMMHTETNRMDAEDAPRWLWRQWHNAQLLIRDGVPLVGFTWYSLNDQIDWHIGMKEALGTVYPVGLVDMNRDPRQVGLAYKHLIDMYRDVPQYRECEALREMLR